MADMSDKKDGLRMLAVMSVRAGEAIEHGLYGRMEPMPYTDPLTEPRDFEALKEMMMIRGARKSCYHECQPGDGFINRFDKAMMVRRTRHARPSG